MQSHEAVKSLGELRELYVGASLKSPYQLFTFNSSQPKSRAVVGRN